MIHESKRNKAVFEGEIKKSQCSFHRASASQSKYLTKEEAGFAWKACENFLQSLVP